MLGILSRLRKPSSKKADAVEVVESTAEHVPGQETVPPPVVDRKIHPDLDALAAELERNPRKSSDAQSVMPPIPTSDTLALTPATRPKRKTHSASPPAEPAQHLRESSTSLSTSSSSETRAKRLLTRLKTFGQQTPPSAWSTFGRRPVRQIHSVPHLTDFGGSVPSHSRPPSSAASQQSHNGTRPETPSTWHSHSSPIGETPMNTFGSASSPSSGFTFGSHGIQSTLTPVPPLPPLDHLKKPRPSSSMPSMADIRPMAQDIFPSPASQPRARRGRGRRRSRRRRSGSIDGFRKASASSSNVALGSPFSWSGMSASVKGKEPIRPSPPTATPEPKSVEPVTPTAKVIGKRKAEEVEGGGTPPELRKEKQQHRATFALDDPRPHRPSATSGVSSHAPSSYHRKRARLTGQTYSSTGVGESSSQPESRSESDNPASNAFNTGSAASRASRNNSIGHQLFRSQSRSSHRPPSRAGSTRRPPSLSQVSIPISALISPHAPSVSHRSAVFHMRDPRRPAPIRGTPWSLSFPVPADGQAGFMDNWRWKNIVSTLRGRGEEHKALDRVGWTEGGGSPIHAWLFFFGFVLFPVWWIAGFLIRIPKTRRIGGGEVEKGVVLDDPQVEFDARSWRTRCRVMSVLSVFTYIPFIVLVAVFASR